MEKIYAKNIVNRTKNTAWFGCEYNMNIYKGCSGGCIYCDSRSECYRVENFDKVKVKENALEIIRNDLRRKVRKGMVSMGSMSDPYNTFEKDLCLTRNSLELLNAYGFGVSIATKSNLILRDIDILSSIKEHSPVLGEISITTYDDELGKKIERSCVSSTERFKTVEALSKEGIYAGVLMMPILPFINGDKDNIMNIVRKTKDMGGRFIYGYFGVTLRDIQREYFYNALDRDFKGVKEKYIKTYGNRYNCNIREYKKMYDIYVNECEKIGLLYKMESIIKSYKTGYETNQLTFL